MANITSKRRGKRMNDNKIINIDLSDLKILIVEDQSEARLMVRNMLTMMGINQVFEAKDGKKAFEFIDDAPELVDLIICDWNMPGMSGVELLRQFRSVDFETPFLMVTGRTDKLSVLEAKNSGVSGYIGKPFSPDQLEAKIRAILYKKELNRAAL